MGEILKILFIDKLKAVYTKKTGYAYYITVSADEESIKLVHTFTEKYYHSNIDRWELPLKAFNQLLLTFGNYKIITRNKNLRNEFLYFKTKHKKILDNQDVVYRTKTKPFKHQIEAFDYAKDKPRFLLSDDMGLGKTKTSIDIAVSRKNQFKHCLVLPCISSLKWNWKEQIEIHSNESCKVLGTRKNKNGVYIQDGVQDRIEDLETIEDEFFLITNIHTIRNRDFLNKIIEMIDNGEIGMIIVDEIHLVKSTTTVTGRALQKLNSYYKLALTGTPLMNSPQDLYSIFLWLGETLENLHQYRQRYFMYGGFGNTQIMGYKNLKELRERLDSVQLRRIRTEVYDLPPKIHHNVYVEMDKKQQKVYTDIKEELINSIQEIMLSPNPLAKLTRLRQVTSCPALLDEKCGLGAKMEQVLSDIREIVSQGHKVIVFSNWVKVLSILKDNIKDLKPLEISGRVSESEREKSRIEFQNSNDHKVILGTIGAMGAGYTLHKASYVLFIDVPWNKALKDQAEDRAHRIGTEHPVSILTYVTFNSIDETIEELVYKKGTLGTYLVDGDYQGKAKGLELINSILRF